MSPKEREGRQNHILDEGVSRDDGRQEVIPPVICRQRISFWMAFGITDVIEKDNFSSSVVIIIFLYIYIDQFSFYIYYIFIKVFQGSKGTNTYLFRSKFSV